MGISFGRNGNGIDLRRLQPAMHEGRPRPFFHNFYFHMFFYLGSVSLLVVTDMDLVLVRSQSLLALVGCCMSLLSHNGWTIFNAPGKQIKVSFAHAAALK